MNKIPFSFESEKLIVLSLIFNTNLLEDYVDSLFPHEFYCKNTSLAYSIIVSLYKNNKPINTRYVYEEMVKQEPDVDISFLIDVDIYVNDIALVVKEIKNFAQRRLLIEKAKKLLGQLFQDKPHEQLMEEIDKSISSLADNSPDIASLDAQFIKVHEYLKERREGLSVVRTGFAELDAKTNGFFAGQLIVIGARTSMGKTSFALSLALNTLSYGKGVLFFSLEMPDTEIVLKSLSIETEIPYYILLKKIDSQEIFEKVQAASLKMREWPYAISDKQFYIHDIKKVARNHKKNNPSCKMIVIDYLGLIRTQKEYQNKTVEIGEITKDLKLLARELQVVIVLLAQLNRETDRGDTIPKLHHLRDSGSIEQDADIILFLHREHYYNKEADPHEATVYIAKQRLGEQAKIDIYFEPELMLFQDPS